MSKPLISIIIPAYNEEKRICKTIDIILAYMTLQNYSWDIYVVDDGSNDLTTTMLQKYSRDIYVLQQPHNLGKGAAVRRGMIESTGHIKVFMDADLSTPIYEIEKIISMISSGVDVCIGSRAVNKNMIKKSQPFYRKWMGEVFNKIVQILVFKGINDTQCGFKGFSSSAANKVFPKSLINGFSFDVEILFLAKKENLQIIEIPVEWYNDERSKVNPIFDSFKMFVELLRIKQIHKH